MTGRFIRKRNGMNIKRFFHSLLACLMVVPMMGSTTSLWSGNQDFTDWSTVVNISGSKFQKVKAGNLVRFVMETRDGAQLQVSYGSSWTNLPDLSARSVSGNFDMLVTQSMVSQLECNSVPSWDNMQHDQSLWLYVAPWCGGGAMGSGNDSDFWTDFLNNENIITR